MKGNGFYRSRVIKIVIISFAFHHVGVGLEQQTEVELQSVGTPPHASPTSLPDLHWNLTARPWRPTYLSASKFLDVAESIARADAVRQASDGSILDTYTGREQYYATPYFAVSVAMLVSNNRARDLLPAGIAAMERATLQIGQGRAYITDDHGEFFIAPLAKAMPLFRPYVPAAQYTTWTNRLSKPRESITRGYEHNWRTYGMKGEWLRAKHGYIEKAAAVNWIETSWAQTQRSRLTGNHWRQYVDRTSSPDTFTYDAAARSNLFTMLRDGYDGASRSEMLGLLEEAAKASLLMQEPSGQAPAGGRSGDHVWNDVYSGNVFASLAEHNQSRDPRLAGQYRHAAMLNLAGIDRWRRSDGAYSVTKNSFDPASRVGYADYSQYTNYNGNVMFHTLESFEASKKHVSEMPSPSEIGGFVLTTDPVFSGTFANAGGMSMQLSTRGATGLRHTQYWTVLGVSRFGRTGWDSRLGPSNGVRDPGTRQGVSFSPTFLDSGRWVRLATGPERYEGTVSHSFVHPLLVRWAVVYAPRSGYSGPTFRNEFIVTPDGVLSTLTSSISNYGMTLPILESDGTALTTSYGNGIARVSYAGSTDEQNFIALQPTASFDISSAPVRGGVGDIRPVRMTVVGAASNQVFVYPRGSGDPPAEQVRSTFARIGDDFTSTLGWVRGTLYAGRTSAGGFGSSIDLDGNGTPDATFSPACNFVLQLYQGKATAVEVDRAVTGFIQGRNLTLTAHQPVSFSAELPVTAIASGAVSGHPAASVLDGNPGTRWAADGVGDALSLDVGSIRGLSALSVAWYQGNTRTAKFDIESSLDGVIWTPVVTGVSSSGVSAALETYPLGALTARYLRIVNRGNSVNPWISVVEARASGW